MTIQHSATTSDGSQPETVSGMAISLAFWLCLLVAAILFAAVSLAPKYAIYLQLRSQFDANQMRLVANEQQAEQLQRVIDAIRNDKDFAAELTRIEFDAVRPDEEVIPVELALKLDARAVDKPIKSSEAAHVWYEPIVKYLASERPLRTGILATTALLVIVAFSMLQPAGATQVASGVRGCSFVWQTFRNRYTSRVR